MRTIRILFLAVIAVALIAVALANTTPVTLTLLPELIAKPTQINYTVSVPLFSVIFAAILAGLLIGFVWEYMREYKHRSEAAFQKRENAKLAREVKKMKVQKARDEGDEVLALLDN